MSLVPGERVLSGDPASLSTIKAAVDSVGLGSLFGDSSGLAAVNTGEYSVITSDIR
jgi:hypothetical protein